MTSPAPLPELTGEQNGSEAAMKAARELPKLLRDWKTPWRATADGILAADGSWIMTSQSASLSLRIVELANYAAATRGEG